jgi:hypothetical protein
MENKLYERRYISSSDRYFWDCYINVLLKKGIPEKQLKWYVNWITQFTRFLNQKPLEQCTAKDVNMQEHARGSDLESRIHNAFCLFICQTLSIFKV